MHGLISDSDNTHVVSMYCIGISFYLGPVRLAQRHLGQDPSLWSLSCFDEIKMTDRIFFALFIFGALMPTVCGHVCW